MTRVTKMKRKSAEKASEFVSLDLKDNAKPIETTKIVASEQEKKKRIRHRSAMPDSETPASHDAKLSKQGIYR